LKEQITAKAMAAGA